MPLKPPHLETEEEAEMRSLGKKNFSKVGRQGPSKYGKGGARIHKAKGKAGRKQ